MPYHVDGTPPAAEQEMLSWQTTGTVRRWRLTMGANGSHVLGYDAAGDLIVDMAIASNAEFFDGWWRLEFNAQQNGSNVDWQIAWTKVNGGTTGIGNAYAGSVGQVAQFDTRFGAGLPDIRVGHITVWSQAFVIGPAYAFADHGFVGEATSDRLVRLSTEESGTVQLAVYRARDLLSQAMGPQPPATLLDLLRECADSDGGLLAEAREDASLVYRERATLYNQTPRLVLAYGDVEPDLEPVEDDQGTRNDRTVNRGGGSSARAVLETGPMSVQAPPEGVGVYDDSIDLSLASDDQIEPIAWWLLHLGTWDEARYPTIRLALHKRPHLIRAFLALELGDRVQITGLPPWLPPGPIDLLVQGITETPGVRTWYVTLTCVPAGPWTVAVTSDPERGRLDSSGCTLGGAGATTTATTLTLVTAPGVQRWIDSAAFGSQFPFNVVVGGEEVTVTAITGTTTTQTATVVRSVNGVVKSHPAGTKVSLAQPVPLAL
jgi:hypothetical protein